MKRAMIIGAALALAGSTAAAATENPGEALLPGASHHNDAAAPVFVVLTLAPDAVFANSSDQTFRILTARQLREVADAAADPRVIAHEDAIASLEAQLAELEADLDAFDAARDRRRKDAP